jgi:hypothetical protein
MNTYKSILPRHQKGQALILGIFLVLATTMTAVLMYNNGQTTTEKTRLVNAADAAAYSGAVFVARNLNFLAYTNRAMIANHVAIGHFISYVSWVRYVEESIDQVNRYAQFIPYAREAFAVAKKSMGYVKVGTETVAPLLVKGTDTLNKILHRAQNKSRATISGVMSVSSGMLNVRIMDKVAKTYDPSIRVNYKKDVNTTGGKIAALQVTTDIAKIFQFVKRYTAKKDDGRIKTMVENSYNDSAPWINGNRGWKRPFVFIKFYKIGSTKHTMDGDITDWEANDAFYVRWLKRWKWKTAVLADGKASAREFNDDYQGIHGYYDLRKPGKDSAQKLNISALATMPISSTRFMQLMGMKPGAQRLAALSRAEVFHSRPEKGFTKIGKGEYANLYNPFWQVRLTENQI